MIDVIPEPVDIPITTPLVRQMTSEDDLSEDEVVVADPKSRDTFVGGPTSTTPKIAGLTVNLAGDVTAGVASSADLAEVVTAGVAPSADPNGDVTAGVTSMEEYKECDVVLRDVVLSQPDPDESSAELETIVVGAVGTGAP